AGRVGDGSGCHAEDGIRSWSVTGVQTCALPLSAARQSGAATIEQQHTLSAAARIAAKGLVLLAAWLIASLGAVAALALWTSYGGIGRATRRGGKEASCVHAPLAWKTRLTRTTST